MEKCDRRRLACILSIDKFSTILGATSMQEMKGPSVDHKMQHGTPVKAYHEALRCLLGSHDYWPYQQGVRGLNRSGICDSIEGLSFVVGIRLRVCRCTHSCRGSGSRPAVSSRYTTHLLKTGKWNVPSLQQNSVRTTSRESCRAKTGQKTSTRH